MALGDSGRSAIIWPLQCDRNLTLPERRSLFTSPWDLEAGLWFRRGLFAMLSPVHGCLRRVQAEVPLTQFVQISRASYHTAAAETLHLDVIRTIGEHRPIREKLRQSAVSSPVGRCIIVPPLVLVVVNLTATTPLLRFLIATGVAEDSGFAVPSLEGRLARRHP
jgi:hypothetical protein